MPVLCPTVHRFHRLLSPTGQCRFHQLIQPYPSHKLLGHFPSRQPLVSSTCNSRWSHHSSSHHSNSNRCASSPPRHPKYGSDPTVSSHNTMASGPSRSVVHQSCLARLSWLLQCRDTSFELLAKVVLSASRTCLSAKGFQDQSKDLWGLVPCSMDNHSRFSPHVLPMLLHH